MNRIVREHYPVANLPEDIRHEFSGQDEVTLIVSAGDAAEPAHLSPSSGISDEAVLAELRREPIRGGDFSRFKHLRREHFESAQEADAYLDALRNEWAHRER